MLDREKNISILKLLNDVRMKGLASPEEHRALGEAIMYLEKDYPVLDEHNAIMLGALVTIALEDTDIDGLRQRATDALATCGKFKARLLP